MRTDNSIVHTFTLYVTVAACCAIMLLGYFWISQEVSLFRSESRKIRYEYMESRKFLVQNEVRKVIDYVHYMRSQRETRLKDSIRARVYEAELIAQSIYNMNKKTKSKAEIALMIKNSLRSIRFNNGRGYYFATNLNGTEELFADHPEMEGRNLIDLRDTNGKYVIREMIDIANTSGEGFCEYMWTKPGMQGNDHPKIAYVKKFAPMNWLVGTGEYMEDVESDIKTEILNRIARIRFGSDGYIFVVSFDGVTLMNDTQRALIGKNIWNMTDPNGVKVIQEERKAAETPHGDFISYTWEKPTTGVKAPKISFVQGVREWQWMIGAGVYVDEIEPVIAQRKAELLRRVRNDLLKTGTIMISLIALFIAIARHYSGIMRKSFDTFISFFGNAATKSLLIDPNSLHFSEFKTMAESANSMIEKRKKAESAVMESEKRYRRLFEQSQDAIIIHDFEGHISDVNVSACRMLGYDKKQLLAMNLRELLPEEAVTDYTEALETVRSTSSHRYESTLMGHDGSVIQTEVSMRIVDTSRGLIQEIVRDVTEHKYLEEQLRVRERMDSLGTLAGGIAHDFNNLLAGIIGNLDILRLQSGNLPREYAVNIEEALQSCERAVTLTRNIQSLSMGSVSEFTSVDIHAIAREVFTILERTTDRMIEKAIDFEEGRYYIFGKADQIHQVFLNLGTNAVHAIEDKGVAPGDRIMISACDYIAEPSDRNGLAAGGYVHISFSDTGTGMTEEVKNRAFDPLFSTKQRSAHKGQGLGLAMVYNIVTRNHNGRISIDTREGAGATFHMYLPKAAPPAPVTTEKPADAPRGHETILIVEDEDAVRKVTERVLHKYGYATISATDGDEGLSVFREKRAEIDLILLDLTMPKLSGGMLLDEIIAIDPGAKVVISSGQSEEDLKKISRARGYIAKPYRSDDLAKAIRNALDG